MTDLICGDFQGFVTEIEIARNRDFNEKTGKAIFAFLADIGWEAAKDLVGRFVKLSTIPSNVYGALQTMHAELRESVKYSTAWKEAHKDELKQNTEAWIAFSRLLMFSTEKCSRHVAAYDKGGNLAFATFEMWEKAGRPEHWQRVVSHPTNNPEWERALVSDEMNGGDTYCAEYLNGYYDALAAYLSEQYQRQKEEKERLTKSV